MDIDRPDKIVQRMDIVIKELEAELVYHQHMVEFVEAQLGNIRKYRENMVSSIDDGGLKVSTLS